MAEKVTKKLVVVIECEYDPERFEPVPLPPGKAGLCDVAMFIEFMARNYCRPQRTPAPYELGDATAYTLEGFMQDYQEGKIADGRPTGQTADAANRKRAKS